MPRRMYVWRAHIRHHRLLIIGGAKGAAAGRGTVSGQRGRSEVRDTLQVKWLKQQKALAEEPLNNLAISPSAVIGCRSGLNKNQSPKPTPSK